MERVRVDQRGRETRKASEGEHPPILPPPESLLLWRPPNGTETWYESLHTVIKALNATLHSNLLCRPGSDNLTEERQATLPGRDDNSYRYILFIMFLFAATVGSLILGYTRSRKVDKHSDPYHVYIKNQVSML
ncbi:potassium voltage-gated channel subfamily E member 3-like [Orcinus orca]|uniref:potassium voltage-gated channel subfamily E member 3-like n=1 Tax=Orcinus orca TaxID=9733 RepID=UPI00062BB37D|nr:potassium voltage-gated channel subfamily E member 3-like [Orcinus orca]